MIASVGASGTPFGFQLVALVHRLLPAPLSKVPGADSGTRSKVSPLSTNPCPTALAEEATVKVPMMLCAPTFTVPLAPVSV